MKLTSLSHGIALATPVAALNCSVASFQSYLDSTNTTATVYSAEQVAQNGTFVVPKSNQAYTTSPENLPALCQVQVNATTEAGTYYSFGLFLPKSWNQRFLAVGNGGYAGGINYIDMGAGVGYGFAVMSTDTGHSGAYQDTDWAYNNPDSVTDWGWRAMHGSTVISKSIIQAWYGSASAYNYFSGCSVGGRQGLRAIELFPEDYDGVSVGAPAWWTTHLQLNAVKTLTYNTPSDASHVIPQSMYQTLNDEVIRQCDPQDGYVDNIISDPLACRFNPLTLLCNSTTATDCLNADQIGTLYRIYSDWVDVNDTFIFPHYLLGTESAWANNIGTGGDASLENQSGFARNLLGLGPSWSYQDLDYSTVQLAEKINPGNATADDFDLTPFHERGGKVIHHHGLSDATLATGSSIYFYEHVAEAVVPQGAHMDDFYRMFLIPGMDHCMSTPSTMEAPWYIAGANQAASLGASVSGVPGFRDAKHDVILALMAWVEGKEAPDDIIATVWTNDQTHTEVYRQRPICKYPLQAKYIGSGDGNSADNWSCDSLY